MKKVLLMCCMVLFVAGCGKYDRVASSITGKPSTVCVEGVNYLQFTSGSCVQVDINGKPVSCK